MKKFFLVMVTLLICMSVSPLEVLANTSDSSSDNNVVTSDNNSESSSDNQEDFEAEDYSDTEEPVTITTASSLNVDYLNGIYENDQLKI
ncbi:hypothetical protein FEZ08_10705, partial [Culicoidibacter larvae]